MGLGWQNGWRGFEVENFFKKGLNRRRLEMLENATLVVVGLKNCEEVRKPSSASRLKHQSKK